jgi:hypothetical protein
VDFSLVDLGVWSSISFKPRVMLDQIIQVRGPGGFGLAVGHVSSLTILPCPTVTRPIPASISKTSNVARTILLFIASPFLVVSDWLNFTIYFVQA